MYISDTNKLKEIMIGALAIVHLVFGNPASSPVDTCSNIETFISSLGTACAKNQACVLCDTCPDACTDGCDELDECKFSNDESTSPHLHVGITFGAAGAVTLYLYFRVSRLSSAKIEAAWGYLRPYKRIWLVFTTVTAVAVVYTMYWITFEAKADDILLAFIGVVVFMSGALLWPVGILYDRPILAQGGVALTAAGSVCLLMFVVIVEDSAPLLPVLASIQVVIHHCIVDGLWAVESALTPFGTGLLIETFIQ